MAGPVPTSTAFFKVCMPGFEKRLSLPPSFTDTLQYKRMDRARILSCLGSWPIEVTKRADGLLYFEDGWSTFVKRHGLEVGNFIVFELVGKMVFDVIIYEPLGHMKEFPPPPPKRAYTYTRLTNTPSSSGTSSSFSMVMGKTHGNKNKGYATIPFKFASSNDLAGRRLLELRVPSAGRSWQVELGDWDGGVGFPRRVAIKSKGWHRFYQDNQLKLHDTCTFSLRKLPHSRRKPVKMDVCIRRAD